MRIDWWTLVLQAINVLILVGLLSRFLYRPVMDAIAARQAAADRLLADAESARKAAVDREAQAKELNDGFVAEAAKRRAALEASMEAEHRHLLDQAREEARGVVEQGHVAMAAERARLTSELEERAAALAVTMAKTLLGRLPDETVTDALFAALLDHVRALPVEERGRLAADAPLELVTAMPLEAARQDRYRDALAAELPWAEAPSFIPDPALIAGFEIRGPHIQVRNSWRADLDAMLARLRDTER